jgi:O-antigen ligase
MGLNTSRAVLSVGTVLLAATALWYQWQNGWRWPQGRRELRNLAWAMSSLFGLALLSGLNTDSDWGTDVYAKIPLLLLPWAVAVLPDFSLRQKTLLVLGYLLTQTVVALISLGIAAADLEATMVAVERNASITIATGASHIYFGLTLAFAACLGIFWWRQDHPPQVFKQERWLCLALGVIDFVALHFFTSRTGLMALYAGVGLGGLFYLVQRRAWRLGIGLLLLMTLTPTLAFHLLPSFRVRVEVTLWDYEQYQQPEADLTYNSASLRLLAWETAAEIIAEHPLTGVGLRDVKDEMEAQYARNGAFERANVPLDDPHNQYLHYLVGAGVGAFLLLLFVLAYPLWRLRGPSQVLMAALIGTVLAALAFESILQRQIGMTYFALFYVLVPGLGREPDDAHR